MTMTIGKPAPLAVLAGLLLALTAAPAAAELPRTYSVQAIDSPQAGAEANFGLGIVNAGDLDGDAEDDLLAAQPFNGPGAEGQLFVISGSDGSTIDTVNAPDPRDGDALFGFAVNRLGDVGSCAGGDSGQLCAAFGPRDGVPDLLVSAPFADAAADDAGRVYVLDGATRGILKRIDLPAADLAAAPFFGRSVLAPLGEPPCAGNAGIGACAATPQSVRAGDVSGDPGATPDIVIGAPNFDETTASNPNCSSTCDGAGRAYVYYGETIAGTSPATIESTPDRTVLNPMPQPDGASSPPASLELMGQSSYPIGDVNGDDRPEYVLAAHRTDDSDVDSGVAYLFDGATGALLTTYQDPEPQREAYFGFTFHGEPAPGNLGGGPEPDVFLPAHNQNAAFTAQGRGYVMNGDPSGTPALSVLNDPTPATGSAFGISSSGLGDVAPGDATPANELLVGAFGPNSPGINPEVRNDVHIFNAATETALQSIADPDAQRGSGFGSGVAPLGDVNGDGFLDFAVGADLHDTLPGGNEGRLYIFRSDNSTPPVEPPVTPVTPPAATVLSGRTISLSASRNSVRRGGRRALRGVVEAFANPAACIGGQQVELQSRTPGQARYTTLARLTTDADGDFGTIVVPERSLRYRARLAQTAQCLGDVSGDVPLAVVSVARLVTRLARLSSSGSVRFQLACPAGPVCNGSVKLRTLNSIRLASGKHARVTLGTSAFQARVAAGARRACRWSRPPRGGRCGAPGACGSAPSSRRATRTATRPPARARSRCGRAEPAAPRTRSAAGSAGS